MPRWNNKNCGFQKGHKSFLTKLSIEKIRLANLGKTFRHSQETKDKIRLRLRGKKYPERMGINNPAWKGGITPINQKIRNSLLHKCWSKSVLKKDNYICQICGIKKGKRIAHHIKSFSEYPNLRFAIDNGMTLCLKCHRYIHKLNRDELGRFLPNLLSI